MKRNNLKKIIQESVRQTINELDWKTYANAAKKRLQQYRDDPTQKDKWNSFYDLEQMANKRFDDEYVGNMKYDTFGDKWRGKHSPKFDSRFSLSRTDRMPYGAINGYNKGGGKIFSTEKDTYHANNGGITNPSRFFRDKEVADKFRRANDELWDYDQGNYEYVNGEGWRLKEAKRIRNIVKETLNRVLKESYDSYEYDNVEDSDIERFNDNYTEVTVPDYCLPYLVNGDMDNYDEEELEAMQEFEQEWQGKLANGLNIGDVCIPLDGREPSFRSSNDIFGNIGSDCYRFLVPLR